jgi:hypothetical protein
MSYQKLSDHNMEQIKRQMPLRRRYSISRKLLHTGPIGQGTTFLKQRRDHSIVMRFGIHA